MVLGERGVWDRGNLRRVSSELDHHLSRPRHSAAASRLHGLFPQPPRCLWRALMVMEGMASSVRRKYMCTNTGLSCLLCTATALNAWVLLRTWGNRMHVHPKRPRAAVGKARGT